MNWDWRGGRKKRQIMSTVEHSAAEGQEPTSPHCPHQSLLSWKPYYVLLLFQLLFLLFVSIWWSSLLILLLLSPLQLRLLSLLLFLLLLLLLVLLFLLFYTNIKNPLRRFQSPEWHWKAKKGKVNSKIMICRGFWCGRGNSLFTIVIKW